MQSEVDEFIRYCRLERRLAELSCSAYERDVTACACFLQSEGFPPNTPSRRYRRIDRLLFGHEKRLVASEQNLLASESGFSGPRARGCWGSAAAEDMAWTNRSKRRPSAKLG